jgi:predicted transcriptional regulator
MSDTYSLYPTTYTAKNIPYTVVHATIPYHPFVVVIIVITIIITTIIIIIIIIIIIASFVFQIFALHITGSIDVVLSKEHRREICRHIYNHQVHMKSTFFNC